MCFGCFKFFSPERWRKFQKLCKKSKKNYDFLNFQENFAIFSKYCWQFYRILGENLGKNLDILEIWIYSGSGAESPDASEFLEIWVEKSMENWNFG